jgi:hypothetical protein
MNIGENEIKVQEYEVFYNKKNKPLVNLLNYLKYITEIYKVTY